MSTAPTEVPFSTHDLAECLMSAAIGKVRPDTWRAIVSDIEKAIDTAVAAERERCAGIAKRFQNDADDYAYATAKEIESAIREGKS